MSQRPNQSYEQARLQLDNAVARMGGLVESLLWTSFSALERRNPTLAAQAVHTDIAVDRLEREVREKAIDLIVEHDLSSDQLHHSIAVLKVAGELERVGDLSKNLARRAMTISGADQPRHILVGLEHMTELVARQLKDVLDAWAARDVTKALAVWRGDAALDALYNSVFRELLAWMVEDPRNIEHCAHLLFAAKNLERIGDHTTNIAEHVRFVVTGFAQPHDRQKCDDTSSITTIGQ